MVVLGGVFVLRSGLRILIRVPQVPFSVPPKTPSQWASYCAESEKISLYVEIHRKNPVDVMIQELVSKVQFPRPFLRIKRFLADFWVRQWKMFFSKQPKKLNFWNHILNPHIKPVLSVYLNISGYFSLKVPSCALFVFSPQIQNNIGGPKHIEYWLSFTIATVSTMWAMSTL